MLRYRVLRWLAQRTSGQRQAWLYAAAWAMLGHYVLIAQHAVEDAEDEWEHVTDVVAEEAASIVKEYTPTQEAV